MLSLKLAIVILSLVARGQVLPCTQAALVEAFSLLPVSCSNILSTTDPAATTMTVEECDCLWDVNLVDAVLAGTVDLDCTFDVATQTVAELQQQCINEGYKRTCSNTEIAGVLAFLPATCATVVATTDLEATTMTVEECECLLHQDLLDAMEAGTVDVYCKLDASLGQTVQELQTQCINEGYYDDTVDCGDCVTQAQYDTLYSLIAAQQSTIDSLTAQIANVAGLEATVNDVDTQLTNLATCLSYDSPVIDIPTEDSSTPSFTEVSSLAGVVCGSGSNRTFKNKDHSSAEECAAQCAEQSACTYFSYRESNNDCIGCAAEPHLTNSFTPQYTTYVMSDTSTASLVGLRRQMSELELLRAENEALKDALETVRRN